ncbi:MAG: AmpG family muropeptide MFS transporter [Nitrospirae bacterium]|nr:AmpG family muropeptide MFS transporter [Candidatus Troglogloeales bacterium]
MAVLLLLGFSSGLPLALTFGTLQAVFKDAGMSLTEIGAVTLIGLPYTIKFLWAPLLDWFTPPFSGRRRGWLLIMQLALIAAIVMMARFDPATQTIPLVLAAVVVAFLSATQDIAVDAYRSDILEHSELGAGASVFVLGYRLGMLVSGAFALILSDHFPWQTVYMMMAPFMLIGIMTVLWADPEPKVTPPRTLTEAVVLPFLAFFRDKGLRGTVLLLSLIILYKLPDALAGAMTTPFLMDIGFSKTDIGIVNKGLGLLATIVGGLAGGAIFADYGLYRSLWIFGILQGVSNLVFTGLALAGPSTPGLFLAVGIENLSGGMGSTAFVALLMSLTQRQYSATQYALFSSLAAMTSRLIGPVAGSLAETLHFPLFYAVSTLGMIPGLMLLWAGRRLLAYPESK